MTMNRSYLDALGTAIDRIRPAVQGDAGAVEALRLADQLLAGMRARQGQAHALPAYTAALRAILPDVACDMTEPAEDLQQAAARWVAAHGAADDAATRAAIDALLRCTDAFQHQGAAGPAAGAQDAALPALTPERLAPHVKAVHPAATIRDVVAISGGYSKRTARILLDGAGAGIDEIILRQDLAVGPFGTTVLDEFAMLRALSRSDLPVAPPLLLCTDDAALGGPFMLVRKLPGSPPGGNVTGFAAGVDGRDVARKLAALAARVHRVDVRAIGYPGAAADMTPHARIRAQVDRVRDLWRHHSTRESLPLELGFWWVREHLTADIAGDSLVHGDLSLANVLLCDGEISALLDWEFSHIGDPAEDLAYCRPVIEAVLPWEEFMAAYAAAGGPSIPAARLRFFEVFAKLRLAAMCRITGQLYARGDTHNIGFAAADAHIAPLLEQQLLGLINAPT